MDWTADSPTITEHQPNVRRHGYLWNYDGARSVLQISQAVCIPTWVSCCTSAACDVIALPMCLVYALPPATEYQGLGLSLS
jgi:hypothetical protein